MSNMQFEKTSDGGWRVLEPVWDWTGDHRRIATRILEALKEDPSNVLGAVMYVGRNHVRYYEILRHDNGGAKTRREGNCYVVATRMRTRRNPFPHYFKDNK